MKIKMLKDAQGSEDGFSVSTYLAGGEYEVGEELADAFVDDMKVAERVGASGAVHAAREVAGKVADAVTGKGRKAKADDPPAE